MICENTFTATDAIHTDNQTIEPLRKNTKEFSLLGEVPANFDVELFLRIGLNKMKPREEEQ
jgi:hypothetical protein